MQVAFQQPPHGKMTLLGMGRKLPEILQIDCTSKPDASPSDAGTQAALSYQICVVMYKIDWIELCRMWIFDEV